MKKAKILTLMVVSLLLIPAAVLLAGAKPEETGSTGSTTETAQAGKYQEHPVLAKMVEEGKLPPVEERLPEDVFVVQGLKSNDYKTGNYGGTANLYNHRGWLRPFNALYFAGGSHGPFRVTPTGEVGPAPRIQRLRGKRGFYGVDLSPAQRTEVV